jgi:hypothetical protein
MEIFTMVNVRLLQIDTDEKNPSAVERHGK